MGWTPVFLLSCTNAPGSLSRRMAILGVMAVFLYQVTGIFYKTIMLPFLPGAPSTATELKEPLAAPDREPADAYRVIPARNLFGTATQAVTEERAATANQQPDILRLIDLKGTVTGGTRYGFAIIEERATRKQRLVKVGDVVTGATVARIRRNAIDLLVNERQSTLEMRVTKRVSAPAPAKLATAPAAPSGARVVGRRVIQEAMANIGTILTQARVRPYMNAGVPDGFVINSIQPGSLYQQMGIANGDIIQEVNHRKIRTVGDVMGLLNTIRSGASLSLGIKRRDKPATLTYQFQ